MREATRTDQCAGKNTSAVASGTDDGDQDFFFGFFLLHAAWNDGDQDHELLLEAHSSFKTKSRHYYSRAGLQD